MVLKIINSNLLISSFFIKNLIFFSFDSFIYFYNVTYYYIINICIKNFFYNFLIFKFIYIFARFNFFYLINILKLSLNIFNNLFFLELFLDGLYYRIKYYRKYNSIGFILGYNHYILFRLNQNVFAKVHMKKRRFYLYSSFKKLLSLTAIRLVELKFPNLFKGKGVKILPYKYRLKIKKKKK